MTFRKNQSRENHIYYYTTKKHPNNLKRPTK